MDSGFYWPQLLRAFLVVSLMLTNASARATEADPHLGYSTLFGPDSFSHGASAVAIDPDGNLVVAGSTSNTELPLVNSLQATLSPDSATDLFIAKFDPTGRTLLFSTYLGGVGSETLSAIDVDAAGNIYLTGTAEAGSRRHPEIDGLYEVLPPGFPTTAGALQREVVLGECTDTNGAVVGCSSVFVAKISADGRALIYSTFVGGNGSNRASDLAVLPDGRVALGGESWATDFPQTVSDETGLRGDSDGFVAVLSADGSALSYSRLLGGGGVDRLTAVASTSTGDLLVGGVTNSADFPVNNALQVSKSGSEFDNDGFLAKLTVGENDVVWATYWGGSGNDVIADVAASADDGVFVLGDTHSDDFPVFGAIQPSPAGFGDLFVSHLAAAGDSLISSTYLGGSRQDTANAMDVDAAGRIVLVGRSESAADFPQVESLTDVVDLYSTVLIRLDLANASIDYARALNLTRGLDTVVSASGSQWVVGETSASFRTPLVNPLEVGKARNVLIGGTGIGAFIARLDLVRPAMVAELALSQSPEKFVVLQGQTQEVVVTLSNVGTETATDIAVRQSIPSGLQLVSAFPEVGSYDVSASRWRIASLAPNQTAQLRLRIAPGEPIFAALPEFASVLEGSVPVDLRTADNLAISRTATSIQDHLQTIGLNAAVLPAARSVRVGDTATVFASMLWDRFAALNCTVEPVTEVPATFEFIGLDPVTNLPMGSPGEPQIGFGIVFFGAAVSTGQLEAVNFMLSMTPTAAFPPTEIEFAFRCENFTEPAPFVSGVNSLVLSSSDAPQPDLVAVAATPGNTGFIRNLSPESFVPFAVATTNLGATGDIVVKADTGERELDLDLRICETDPESGQCVSPALPAAGPLATTIEAGATPTFAIFAREGMERSASGGAGALARVYVRFENPQGELRGATSVAIF